MAFCRKCGAQIQDGAKFCPKCGTSTGSNQGKRDSYGNSSCSIELTSAGVARLQVTRALMDLLGVEINEANNILDSIPCTLATGISLSRAEEIEQKFQTIGAKILIKQNDNLSKTKKPIQNNPSFLEQARPIEHVPKTYVESEYQQYSGNYNNSGYNTSKLIFRIIVGITIFAGCALWIYSWESYNEVSNEVDELFNSKGKDQVEQVTKETHSLDRIKTNTPEEKEYAKAGYNDGSEFGAVGELLGGFFGVLDLAESVATEEEIDGAIRNSAIRSYDEKYDNPTTSHQERLKELYIRGYIEGFKNATKDKN